MRVCSSWSPEATGELATLRKRSPQTRSTISITVSACDTAPRIRAATGRDKAFCVSGVSKACANLREAIETPKCVVVSNRLTCWDFAVRSPVISIGSILNYERTMSFWETARRLRWGNRSLVRLAQRRQIGVNQGALGLASKKLECPLAPFVLRCRGHSLIWHCGTLVFTSSLPDLPLCSRSAAAAVSGHLLRRYEPFLAWHSVAPAGIVREQPTDTPRARHLSA
jgi:hypothetical protein